VPRPASSPDPDSVGTGKAGDCSKSRANAIIWQIENRYGKVLKSWKFMTDKRCN